MRTTGAGLFPIALLSLLAALTFWLDRATQQEGNGRDGKHRHDPDYIADNFHVRRYDAEGALQHTLVAQKMLHYPDDESTEVIAPQLTYNRNPPARVYSDKAWLDKDGKHVRLDGNVHIIREGSSDRPPTEIVTSVLYAVPDDEFAHTDAPVTITQGQTVITGSGMETSNKTRISILSGPVRGTIYRKQVQQANSTQEPSQHETHTAATVPADQPARPATGVRGKGRQGQARQSRGRPHHGR